jgi:hypothetical protein
MVGPVGWFARGRVVVFAGLGAVAGCILLPTPDESGACELYDPDGPGYWCDDDYEAYQCESDASDVVGHTFQPGSTCADLGYDYYCTAEQMAASGGPAYVVPRLLGNAACDASRRPGEPGEPGGAGGSCLATNGICTDSEDPMFESGCNVDPDNPANVFTPGGRCPDTGVSCTGGVGDHPTTGAPMQIDVYYPPELCAFIRECESLLGGDGVGGC